MNDEPFRLTAGLIRDKSTAVVGLGNPDRADDGAGIKIVSMIKARFPERVFLDTEMHAEGIVFELLEDAHFETILFIDAVHFGGREGEIRLFTEKEIPQFVPSVSSHKVPITLLMQLILIKNKKTVLLGIQPKSLEWMGAISPEVANTIEKFENYL